MSDSNSQPQNTVVGRHYDFIDGLRGIAVLIVIWFHAANFTFFLQGSDLSGVTEVYYFYTLLGQTGVDLFFVISGFLITGILMDIEKQENAFEKFYIRRSLRILPLYYVVVILALGLSVLLSSQSPDFGVLLSHLVFLQNWSLMGNGEFFRYLNHTWTLAVEEQFYLLWPCVFWFFRKKSLRYVIILMIAMILTSWFLRFYITGLGYYKFAFTATFCRFDTLAMGALISVCFRHYRPQMEKLKPIFLWVMLLSLGCLTVLCAVQENGIDAHRAIIRNGLTICSIFYGSLLSYLLLCDGKSKLKGFLQGRVIRKTGHISYGLYLIHVPLMIVISEYLDSFGMGFEVTHSVLFIAGLVPSVILASASYRYFEKPILQLKDRWARLN